MQLSVCAETVYTEKPILERFSRIREHGFDHVELWTIPSGGANAVEKVLKALDQKLVLFCGNRAHSLVDPGDRKEVLSELTQSMRQARQLSCRYLAVLSNAMGEGGVPFPPKEHLSDGERLLSVYEGLRQVAALADAEGIELLIEPLNTIVDHPGYFLRYSEQAFELIRAIGSPCLKVLFDIYHLQIMEGNIVQTLEEHLDLVGHIHVADVPGRHELGTGELNWRRIADMLRANGYRGLVGLECFPRENSDTALLEFKKLFA